jgi:hypothetical protein
MSYSRNKRDANEKVIVSLWRHMGLLWIQMDKDKGFDGLLVTPTGNRIIEIKNPAIKWTLTDDEKLLKIEVEAAGGVYWIVTDDETALKAARGES